MACLLWSMIAWQYWLGSNKHFPLPLAQPIWAIEDLIISSTQTIWNALSNLNQIARVDSNTITLHLNNMNSIPRTLLQMSSSPMRSFWSIFIPKNSYMLLEPMSIPYQKKNKRKRKGKEKKKKNCSAIEALTFLYQETCHESLVVIFPHVHWWNTPFIIPNSEVWS